MRPDEDEDKWIFKAQAADAILQSAGYDPEEVAARSRFTAMNAVYHLGQASGARRVGAAIFLLASGVLLILALSSLHLELFEDGSFILRGCLPWAVCALP